MLDRAGRYTICSATKARRNRSALPRRMAVKAHSKRLAIGMLFAGIIAYIGASGALAQTGSLQWVLNEAEPPINPASLVVYPTLPLGLGDIDAEVLAVTDKELLA